MKRYSSLTAKQKDKSNMFLNILKNGLEELPHGFAVNICLSTNVECFRDRMKGEQMFKYNDVFLPMNWKDLTNRY